MTTRPDIGVEHGMYRVDGSPPRNTFPQVGVWRQGPEVGAENSAASKGSSAWLTGGLAPKRYSGHVDRTAR